MDVRGMLRVEDECVRQDPQDKALEDKDKEFEERMRNYKFVDIEVADEEKSEWDKMVEDMARRAQEAPEADLKLLAVDPGFTNLAHVKAHCTGKIDGELTLAIEEQTISNLCEQNAPMITIVRRLDSWSFQIKAHEDRQVLIEEQFVNLTSPSVGARYISHRLGVLGTAIYSLFYSGIKAQVSYKSSSVTKAKLGISTGNHKGNKGAVVEWVRERCGDPKLQISDHIADCIALLITHIDDVYPANKGIKIVFPAK